jgi:ferric-dicitrate binding protein FerR (iron transport regulator)
MKSHSPEELITRYLDDSASESEMAQLNHLLATSAGVRNQFHASTEQAMAIVEAIQAPANRKVIRFPRILAAAACLCGLLALAFALYPEPEATVLSKAGEVRGLSGAAIATGDTLETVGPASLLNFKFRDGTKVHLAGNTVATVTGGRQKRLVVHQGSASLDVTPQPVSAPLILITPTAKLTVKGTSFGVFTSEGTTQLEVAEGTVDLKRLADGHSVSVKAGEYSVASDVRHSFGAKPIPLLGRAWSLDLREDPEDSLEVGVAEFDSKGAIVGARARGGYDVTEVIATENAWSAGDYALFRVEEDSVLKIRLRMDHPGWLNFIVNYRSSEHGSTDVATCVYQDPLVPENLKPGEWRTVEVPLAKPLRIGKHPGSYEGVPVGWSCFSVAVSAAQEKRGLVIERIWTE